MSVKLLLDENLRIGAVWRALEKQSAAWSCDITRIGDASAPPLSTPDDDILQWAAEHDRVVVSRDKRTLIHTLSDWLESGRQHPGLIILGAELAVMEIADILAAVSYASEPTEWQNAVNWLP